jgi:hypothetical protein
VKIISEIEIWRSARAAVAHFGDDARARIQTRAEECEARADIDGWVKWLRIAAAIIEMEKASRRQTTANASATA